MIQEYISACCTSVKYRRLVFIERSRYPVNSGGIIYKKGDGFGLQKHIISSNKAEIVTAIISHRTYIVERMKKLCFQQIIAVITLIGVDMLCNLSRHCASSDSPKTKVHLKRIF